MRIKRLLYILPLMMASGTTPFILACEDDGPTSNCCRVCREGKACGDSCIPRENQCDVGPGCACNG
jgi:hypothetical protein